MPKYMSNPVKNGWDDGVCSLLSLPILLMARVLERHSTTSLVFGHEFRLFGFLRSVHRVDELFTYLTERVPELFQQLPQLLLLLVSIPSRHVVEHDKAFMLPSEQLVSLV